MLYTVYYCIRPNEALHHLLAQYEDIAALLREPTIWRAEEGGYTAFREGDYVARLKLIALLRFRATALQTNNPRMISIMDVLMGSPPFRMEIFDKWWKLERIELGEEFEIILEGISVDAIQLLARTGILHLDAWIDAIVDLKIQGKL